MHGQCCANRSPRSTAHPAVRAGQCSEPTAMNRVCSVHPANSLWHAHLRYALKLRRQNIKAFHAVAQAKKPEECIFLAVCRQSSATSPFSIMLCLKTLQAALLHQEFIVVIVSSPFYPCFPTFLIKFRYSSIFLPYFFLKISRKKLSFSYPTLPMISLTERSVSAKNLDAT